MLNINHFVQVDLPALAKDKTQGERFWMDSCGGRDQVARQVHEQGWAAYEAPLPTLLQRWCQHLQPLFLDVGANTGFYALLAASAGASHVHAFEPVTEIAHVLQENVRVSELQNSITLHACALGAETGSVDLFFPLAHHGLVETSASLNPQFRAQHAEQRQVPLQTLDAVLAETSGAEAQATGKPLLIKIDVETAEASVLAGARQTLAQRRPALVCEILPGTDLVFWRDLAKTWNYVHHRCLPQAPWLQASADIAPDSQARDHVFLPQESSAQWLQALSD